MHIYKRRKMWWVEYQVDGKRYRQSTHTRNYAAAKAWAAQIKTAKTMPTFEEAVEVLRMFYKKPVEGVIPIDAAWETYLELAKAVGKIPGEYTLRYRETTLARFVEWLKKERPTVKTLENVTGPIAAGFATYLANDLKLKTKTRINIIADLNTVFKMLESASTGVRSPWGNLRPQDVDGEVGKAFTPDEERRVLEAAERVGKGWWEICTIMRHSGQRYGDVCRLMWRDVGEDAIRITPHKTARKNISVAIPIIEPIREALARIPKTGDYLFPMHAELYDRRGMASYVLPFREVLEVAGLGEKGYTVHSWRHTAATRLGDAGADLETRKRLLGHRVDTTARRYDHSEHLDETRAALEAAAGQ